MRRSVVVVLTMFILCSYTALGADLKLNLEKGKSYRQEILAESSIKQDINGQEMEMTIKLGGATIYKVMAVNENSYDLKVFYESLTMSTQTPMGAVSFSSENADESNIMSQILAEMKGKTFDLVMSHSGEILEAKNVELLWKSVIDQFEISEFQKKQIFDQLSKAYGSEAMKGSIEAITAIYPNKPVVKGDKWTINTKLNSTMAANIVTEYELVELTSEYAIIRGNATVKTADKEANIKVEGKKIKYLMEGTITSRIKVDRKSGWIINSDITQDMGGKVYMEMGDGMEDMIIPMTIKAKSVVTN